MNPKLVLPPAPDEYASFYGRYIERVIAVPDLREALRGQPAELRQMVENSPDARLAPYAAGKWSVRQVVGHVIDLERIFSYRAFRFSRGDATPLPGFDQDTYVANGGSDARSLAALLDELDIARASTLALIDGTPEEGFERRGVANSVTISARALLYAIAGHTDHHLEGLETLYGFSRA